MSVGDVIFAGALGMVLFIGLMGFVICFTNNAPMCGGPGLWRFVGQLLLFAGVIVAARLLLPRIGSHLSIGGRAARQPATSLDTAQRQRLRMIDAVATSVVGLGFGGMFLYQIIEGEFAFALSLVSLVVVVIAAFVRERVRRRLV